MTGYVKNNWNNYMNKCNHHIIILLIITTTHINILIIHIIHNNKGVYNNILIIYIYIISLTCKFSSFYFINFHFIIFDFIVIIVSSLPSLTTRSVLLDKVFGLPWIQKCEQIRQASPFGNVPGWRLASFIMKAGEDIRREALVMQVISKLNDWFAKDIPPSNRLSFPHIQVMMVSQLDVVLTDYTAIRHPPKVLPSLKVGLTSGHNHYPLILDLIHHTVKYIQQSSLLRTGWT